MSDGRVRRVNVEYRDHPARVLVLICCDGRYIDSVEQYLSDIGEPHHDLIAVPGGPANLGPMTAGILEYQAVTESLDFMVRAHQTHTILLIAHADCAYYVNRHRVCDRTRQEADLRAAVAEVARRHPRVDVRTLYLTPLPDPPGGVAVDDVTEAPSPGSGLLV